MSKKIDQYNQYTVRADRETGEWLGQPEFVGTVPRAQWNARQDTDAVHFDTFEANGETRAIAVVWSE